jgi:hypothetical protein
MSVKKLALLPCISIPVNAFPIIQLFSSVFSANKWYIFDEINNFRRCALVRDVANIS